MTQKELAESAGVTQVTVSRLERFEHAPTPRTVRILAMALKVDPDQLMTPEEDR